MAVAVAALAVLAVIAVSLAVLTRRRLAAEAKERSAAESRAHEHEEQARLAAERAAAAEADANAAGERAEAAEASIVSIREAAAASAGVDPVVLWILEQARSERTWRFSVAPHPEAPSVFTDAANPLLAAVQVELDAAREDVGAVVELDADLPDGLTVSASVLALRATQELLADIVRRSEESTVRIGVDGTDLVVDIDAVDEDGAPVLPDPLPLPPSAAVEVTATGVRIHGAVPPSDARTPVQP